MASLVEPGEKDGGLTATDRLYIETPPSEIERDWTDEEEAKIVRK
jgi:hypothetical protein